MTIKAIRDFHKKLRHSWDVEMVEVRETCETCALLGEIDSVTALILEYMPIEYVSLDDLVRNLLQLTVTQNALIEKLKEKPLMLLCGSCGALTGDIAGHVCVFRGMDAVNAPKNQDDDH